MELTKALPSRATVPDSTMRSSGWVGRCWSLPLSCGSGRSGSASSSRGPPGPGVMGGSSGGVGSRPRAHATEAYPCRRSCMASQGRAAIAAGVHRLPVLTARAVRRPTTTAWSERARCHRRRMHHSASPAPAATKMSSWACSNPCPRVASVPFSSSPAPRARTSSMRSDIVCSAALRSAPSTSAGRSRDASAYCCSTERRSSGGRYTECTVRVAALGPSGVISAWTAQPSTRTWFPSIR